MKYQKIYIYGFRSILDNKWYVGSSFRIDPAYPLADQTRSKEHIKDACKKKPPGALYKAMHEHCERLGYDPMIALREVWMENIRCKTIADIGWEFNILDSVHAVFVDGQPIQRDLDRAIDLESKWICKLNSIQNGYNRQLATKRKRSPKGKKHYSHIKGSPNKGRKHTPQAKLNMSLSKLGVPRPGTGFAKLSKEELALRNKITWANPDIRARRSAGIRAKAKGRDAGSNNPRAMTVQITLLNGEIREFGCKKYAAEFLGVSGVMLNRYIKEGLRPKQFKVAGFTNIKVIGRTWRILEKEVLNEERKAD